MHRLGGGNPYADEGAIAQASLSALDADFDGHRAPLQADRWADGPDPAAQGVRAGVAADGPGDVLAGEPDIGGLPFLDERGFVGRNVQRDLEPAVVDDDDGGVGFQRRVLRIRSDARGVVALANIHEGNDTVIRGEQGGALQTDLGFVGLRRERAHVGLGFV